MLTLFTTPKSFSGYIGVIQTNAIKSWLQLRPQCEVILFGSDEGTAEVATRLDIRHVPEVDCNEYGTPLISSIFKIAQDIGSNQLLCYVNADIILMSDFLPAIRQIKQRPFLLIGQRWDIDCEELIDFSNPQWEAQLRAHLTKRRKLHAPTGLDYFVFPGGLYRDIPPFAVGRPGWDNWMVYRARASKVPVIDATKAIIVVHQNHDYEHHPEGEKGIFKGLEAERNLELLGGWEYSLCVKNARWVLTPQGLRRALTIKHLYYLLNAVPVLVPGLRFLNIPKKLYIRLSQYIRSILGIPLD